MSVVELGQRVRIEASACAHDTWFESVAALSPIWALWLARWHYRRELRRLLRAGPHMIADIGLALDEAHAEMAKPFWRA